METRSEPEIRPAENSESNGDTTAAKKPRIELSSLPTRQYLDKTVVPVLIEALTALDKKRPEDPVQWLGNYILQKSRPSSEQ